MTKDNLQGSNSNANRLEQAKGQLNQILEEMDIWLDDARDDTFTEELFDFSLRAAELAATLGFARPPFEHVLKVPIETYNAITDTREQAQKTSIRVNAPEGMGSLTFGISGPLGGDLVSECDNRLYAEFRSRIRRWKRAIQRIDTTKAKPATTSLVIHGESCMEATIFEKQRMREFAGSTVSYLDDVMKQVSEGFRMATIHGLSPVRTQELLRELGRAAAEAGPLPRALAESTAETQPSTAEQPSQVTVPIIGGESGLETRESLRKRAEDCVKVECGGVFPGVRELARALGCETRPSSLLNAIKSSKYLSARKAEHNEQRKAQPREQELTEVHIDQIAQSTEPDPAKTLDELIDEQATDRRNDERIAKRRVRKCSR